MLNIETARRLRLLQPAAQEAADFTAVKAVLSKMLEIIPVQAEPSNEGFDPMAVLLALPLLHNLLPGVKSVRIQKGDESVGSEWDAEIELEDGIRFGEGNCPAGAILCATIEILSATLPT
jgi:hypothetical protein